MFEWFFALFPIFPDFKKVRSPAASAEMTRQVENFHAERSSNGSCQSRRALQLMDAGSL